MRIIHARKRVFNKDNAFEHKLTLLVWILSILKWKKYGNEVILYTDKETLEDIKKLNFDHLYDEINSEYLEDKEVCRGLDFYCYWAMPKILALKHEALELNNDIVIADQDVVPMKDVSNLWTNTDVTVWSNKEFVDIKTIYPKLRFLSLPKEYKLPKWFSGNAKPLNTGVIHIKDKDIIKLYVNEALAMATNNHNKHNNTNCQTMCNAEQRLLGEIVNYKQLSYGVMQPINKGLFNANGFHTHGYKVRVNNETGLDWHCTILSMIKKLDSLLYEKLINNELFKEEREHIEKYIPVKQLSQYF